MLNYERKFKKKPWRRSTAVVPIFRSDNERNCDRGSRVENLENTITFMTVTPDANGIGVS